MTSIFFEDAFVPFLGVKVASKIEVTIKLHVVGSKIFKIGGGQFPLRHSISKFLKFEISKNSKVGEIEHDCCSNSASISPIFQNSEIQNFQILNFRIFLRKFF